MENLTVALVGVEPEGGGLRGVSHPLQETESGSAAKADKRLRALRARTACGRGALRNPMLSARLLGDLHSPLDREYFLQLHADHEGDIKAMASALGVSLQALYKRFRSLGIKPRELR